MRRGFTTALMILGCVGAGVPALHAQVRVAQWNITNYSAGQRVAEFQTSIYGVNPANNLSMRPDVMVLQEIIEGGGSFEQQRMTGQAAVDSFVQMLNSAPGSPGDWAAAPYVADNGDTGNGLVYRTSRFTFIGPVVALTAGTGTGGPPRDNHRWRLRVAGYSGAGAEIYIYGAHMKAGSTGADQARREPEATRIRNDAATLPAGAHFLLAGDFNVQSSFQTAYQTLVGASGGSASQFFDPINTPGTWENVPSMRFVHTQDQVSTMDSRHDQILISGTLRDLQGLSYIAATPAGNINLAYSGTSWNDANHSYRSWGNDGTSFDDILRTTGNTMVGATIAQALIDSAMNGGHLPVVLDVQVPAKLSAPETIDFGTVAQGQPASIEIAIGNGADIAFSRDGSGFGIDALNYSLAASPGFSAPAGSFSDAAGGGVNTHTIAVDTSAAGTQTGTLTIASDDPDAPVRVINLTAQVGDPPPPQPPPGDYDVNGDSAITAEDLYVWFGALTDVDQNSTVNTADMLHLKQRLRWFEIPDITSGRR